MAFDVNSAVDADVSLNPKADLHITDAVNVDSEQAAKRNNLSKQYNQPYSIVNQFPDEFEKKARAENALAVTERATRLKNYLSSDQALADLASNDIDVLSHTERTFSEKITDLDSSLGVGINQLASTAAFYAHRVIKPLMADEYDQPDGTNYGLESTDQSYAAAQGLLSKRIGELESRKSKTVQSQNQIIQSAKGVGGTLSALYDNPLGAADFAESQIPQMLPIAKAMTIATTTKGAIGANMLVGGIQGGGDAGTQAEQQVRAMDFESLSKNSPDFDNYVSALEAKGVSHDAAQEAAREKIAQSSGTTGAAIAAPFSALISRVGAGVESRFIHQLMGDKAAALTVSGAYKSIIPTVAKESAEEFADEYVTNSAANVGIKLNADKTQDVNKGSLEAGTLGGALGLGFSVAPASTNILFAHLNDQLKAAESEQDKEYLTKLNRAAEATKMAAHSPEEYSELIKAQAEGGAEDIYIDPKVFFQSNYEKYTEASPSIKEQIGNIETGALIKVPMEEYMTNLAATGLANGIIDHVKLDPEAFTMAESKEWAATEGEKLAQDMQQAVDLQNSEQTFKDSQEVVRKNIQSQLDEVNKFTPHVNETYSKVASAYYAARAAKLGIMPEELYNEHNLKVGNNEVLVSNSLNQAEKSLTEMTNELYNLVSPKEKTNENSQLSNVAKTSEQFDYTANSGTLRKIREHSDEIHSQLGGQSEAPVHHNGKFGASTGYTTLAEEIAPDSAFPDGRLEVHVFTDDQIKSGLTEEPSLTFTVEPDGTFQVNGPDQNSETFTKMQKEGLASAALGKGGIAQDTWTALKDPSGKPIARKQLLELMGDVHARIRTWKGVDKAALQWTRSTGATGDISGGRSASTELFQSNQEDKNLYVFHNISERKLEHAYGLGGLAAPSLGISNIDHGAIDSYGEISLIAHPSVIESSKVKTFDSDIYSPRHPEMVETSKGPKLFKGFTDSGNRKYSEYNLTNIVKEMTTKLQAGENFNYGAGSVRASVANKLKTVKQVQKNRAKIISDKDFEKIKEESNAKFWDALEALRPFYKFDKNGWGYANDAAQALTEGDRGLREAFENDPEVRKIADEIKNYLSNLPTAYFEAKVQRAMKLDEFDAAVVPDDASERTLNILKTEGITNIVKYKAGDNADRSEKIKQQQQLLFQGEKGRGFYDLNTNTINLLQQANLSTFLHELGHFFYETDIRIASQLVQKESLTEGEQSLVNDVSTLLKWHGIEGDPKSQLDQWHSMTFEEQRAFHEKTAESFEHYLFTGKAPSIELQSVFRDLARWMTQVYKSIKDFLRINPEAGKLNPEVSAVFDRMLATQAQIESAEYARSMMPLVSTMEDANSIGMSAEEFAGLHLKDVDATNTAVDELSAKSLRDMQWLRNARMKEIKKLKKEQSEARSETSILIKADVLKDPVYRAWQFLTSRIDSDSQIKAREKVKRKTGVDVSTDSLLMAIAKLGGIKKESLRADNLDEENYPDLVFGKPIVRSTEGKTLDQMAEALGELGYLEQDQSGKVWEHDLSEKIRDEARGNKHYSNQYSPEILNGINAHGLNAARLNYSELAADLGVELADKLKARKMTATEGITANDAAVVLGFDSAEELVNKLANAEPLNERIERLTDEKMLLDHGELATPKALEESADRAIHNTLRAKVMIREHNALSKAVGGKRILESAAKEYADNLLAKMRIKDIQPSRFASAEAKAGKLAAAAFRQSIEKEQSNLDKKLAKLTEEHDRAAIAVNSMVDDEGKSQAILDETNQKIAQINQEIAKQKQKVSEAKKGHLENAVKEKRNQIIHNVTTQSAYDIKDEVKSGVQYVKKLRTKSAIRGQASIQIADLMHRFGFTAIQNRKEVKPLGEWSKEEAASLDAAEPNFSALILSSTEKPFTELTVEEFRDLIDAFKQLEFLGRRLDKQYKEIKGQSFKEEKQAFLDELKEVHPEVFDESGKPKNLEFSGVKKFSEKIGSAGEYLNGQLLNPENIAKELSAGRFGNIWDSLFSRMTHASDNKAIRMKAIYEDMKDVFSAYNLAERLAFSKKGIFIKEIGISLTKENMVLVALHNGHEEGRARLANFGWTPSQIQAIVNKLDEKDINLIEKIWDTFDNKLWPELKALNERTIGVAPRKVTAVPYEINGRKVSGGYMKLVYDSNLNTKAQENDAAEEYRALVSGSMGMASTTNQGSSKERSDNVKMLLNLELKSFTRAINETVHDLAFREAGADSLRVLRDKDIANSIKLSMGVPAYNALLSNLKLSVAPVVDPSGFVEKALSIARRNTVTVLMSGFNTAIQNFFGIGATMAKVSPSSMATAMAEFAANPIKQSAFCLENSEYMRTRLDHFDSSLNDMAKRLGVGLELRPLSKYYLGMMSLVDRAVTIPSWNAAFKDGMKEFDNDTSRAIDYADSIIRQTQGSGREVDLSSIMNGRGAGGQLKKVFTMFYSWFNAMYGLLHSEGVIAKHTFKNGTPQEKAMAIAKFTAQFQLIVTMNVVLTEILMRGLPDDNDDPERWAKAFASYGFGMFPIIRDLAGYTMSKYAPSAKYHSNFRLSPIESAVELAVDAPKNIHDIWTGNEKAGSEKSAVMGASFILGLPGKAIWDAKTTVDGWLQGQAWPAAVGPKK